MGAEARLRQCLGALRKKGKKVRNGKIRRPAREQRIRFFVSVS